MNPSYAQTSKESAQSERVFLRVLSFVLLVYAFLITGLLGYQMTHERSLVTPFGSSTTYEIGSEFSSKEYLTDLAYDVLNVFGNVTPDNIGFVRDRVLKFADGESHGELKSQLLETEARVKRDQVSTVWSPRDATVDPATKTVVVTGYITTYLGSVMTSKNPKSYTVQFRINARGRAYVTRLIETEKPATK
jgi:conjugal transfer pilus assembly protein TraE